MDVKDFMTNNVVSVTLKMTVREAIVTLSTSKISGVPVVDLSNKVVSVVSEGSLLKLAAAKKLDRSIESCLGLLPKVGKLIGFRLKATYKFFLNFSFNGSLRSLYSN